MRYQGGGLADAAGVDEEEDPPVGMQLMQPGALEAASTPASEDIVNEAMPDSLQKARELNKMTRDAAITRLTAGREALMKKQYDPSAKWLAMAQGMLAPTRTGGFGESLGNAAGLMGHVTKETQDYESDRELRLLGLESEMAKTEENYATRDIDILEAEETAKSRLALGARGVSFPAYIDDPEHPGQEILARVIADTKNAGGVTILRTEDGRVLRVPDMLDPTARGNVAAAVTRGEINPKDLEKEIDKARIARDRLATTYFGLDVLKDVRKAGGTGGIQNYVQKIREVFGSEAQDVADRGQLMALMGDQLFAALDSFGTQINERELMTAKSELASGATRSTAVNERLLQQLAMKLEGQVSMTQGLAQNYGDAQQRYSATRPLIDYGLNPTTRKRAELIGLTFQDYVPFESDEVKPPPKPRQPGEQGHAGTPWMPKTNAEANALMRDPASAGAQTGDFFTIPDPKNPDKTLTLQVK